MSLSTTVIMTLPKKPFILATMRLCFKLKFLQWEEQHPIFAKTKNKNVVINCNSQVAIMALDNTKIKSKTLDAVLVLNALGENNQVLIRWIPAQNGYVGNEKEDTLSKKGTNKLPLLSCSGGKDQSLHWTESKLVCPEDCSR